MAVKHQAEADSLNMSQHKTHMTLTNNIEHSTIDEIGKEIHWKGLSNLITLLNMNDTSSDEQRQRTSK